MNGNGKVPAMMPGPGSDEPPVRVALGGIVRLKKPYELGEWREQRGLFGFGMVAEILTILPNASPRNVSLYLYDPERKEILLGPNGIPEFVDFHCSEFELYKRATEQGYRPLTT